EVWCSPTSTAMMVAYWQQGPSSRELATIGADPAFDAHGRSDPQVVWAAMHTWDAGYNGTGNWPFNTAYASGYGLDGSVRQYGSLRDVETWILRGVPVVASIAWNNSDASADNDLDGAPIPRSGGHLLVISGFTAGGEVLVADPAAPTEATVRRTYRRAQFERDWLNASTGTAYVIQPVGRGPISR
ncbi:MAG TPA: C39 family peptidase, partial [Kineosporiaceae bacterium]|nr:C39 family peptidase [Kineosporiaceae bacterium]